MSNHPKHTTVDILSELRTQIDAHGEVTGAKIARLKFQDVPASSWSRHVKQVRGEWNEAQRLREAGLPASSIPPSVYAPAGMASDEQTDNSAPGVINWLSQIGGLLKQCDLLTRQSVHVDPTTGVERVRNPMVLRQSISARTAALKLAADRESTQYGAERVAHWEAEMLREINRALGKTRDEAQRVIANRVRNAVLGVISRRHAEREFLGGDMMPKPADESTPQPAMEGSDR
ncbi:hypothetical protein DyAD56_16290 [Dyella sp. AD56]|nr:hypothetical protein DyAD56_16290 [Dyella sp. AD56]